MRSLSRYLLLLSLAAGLEATTIVPGRLDSVLTTGSLAPLSFPVSFSYDGAQVNPIGESFVSLITFDFTLLGVPFHRSDIFQGGQVMLLNGVIENVTASFQVILPPNSPVNNITFGFGGPGAIGYIDLNNQFGSGSFTINAVPEPETGPIILLCLVVLMMFAYPIRHTRSTGGRRSAAERVAAA
jgi:hypothetical protein